MGSKTIIHRNEACLIIVAIVLTGYGKAQFFDNEDSSTCADPEPDYPLTIADTDTRVLMQQLYEIPGDTTNESWTLDVAEPQAHSAWLQTYFWFNDSTVKLRKSFDVEKIFEEHTFDRIIHVESVSEFPPKFEPWLPVIYLLEDFPLSEPVADLRSYVTDDDVRVDGDIQVIYMNLYTGSEQTGERTFYVDSRGLIWLLKEIDYEVSQFTTFYLNVTVQDYGHRTSWALVIIKVVNVNDEKPVFIYKKCDHDCPMMTYNVTVDYYFTGVLTNVQPGPIEARDGDKDPVVFQIISGSPPSYKEYITINKSSGSVAVIKYLTNPQEISHFIMVLQACDNTAIRQSYSGHVPRHCTITSLFVVYKYSQIEFPVLSKTALGEDAYYDPDMLEVILMFLGILFMVNLTAIYTQAHQIRVRQALMAREANARQIGLVYTSKIFAKNIQRQVKKKRNTVKKVSTLGSVVDASPPLHH